MKQNIKIFFLALLIFEQILIDNQLLAGQEEQQVLVESLLESPKVGVFFKQQILHTIAQEKDKNPSKRIKNRPTKKLMKYNKSFLENRARLIRFTHQLSKTELDYYRELGLKVTRMEEKAVHFGAFYSMRANAETLVNLLLDPNILQIDAVSFPTIKAYSGKNKYDVVPKMIAAQKAQIQRVQLKNFNGAAVTLCDMDTAVDIFHPGFFRADAGYYTWIDVDLNGVFNPKIDAVDLNHNGLAEQDELLHVLGGSLRHLYTHQEVEAAPQKFTPAFQWLYADKNMDGVRNYGLSGGFSESSLAYGEPLFIVDDMDQNGLLEVGEKLIRLGSSKIKGVYLVSEQKSYLRGENLIEIPEVQDEYHGTAVVGILVGSSPKHAFVHGIAHGADVLVIDKSKSNVQALTKNTENLVAAWFWAKQHGCQIALHEYGVNYGAYADGSSPWEALLDQMSMEGMAQTTATHNFAESRTHSEFKLAAGESLFAYFSVSAAEVFFSVYSSLRWISDVEVGELELTLTLPNGVEMNISEAISEENVWVTHERNYLKIINAQKSSRGTNMLLLRLFSYKEESDTFEVLQSGEYKLSIKNKSTENIDFHWVLTGGSHYGSSAYILENENVKYTQEGTIAFPSTADSAISVGASMGNFEHYPGDLRGSLRAYSDRGPRIDGVLGIDVVAPADHYSFAPASVATEKGSYVVFAGTSGALPLVAGSVALLLQKEPNLTPAQVKSRLQSSSIHTELTGELPNNNWGYGHLNAYKLLFGELPSSTENHAPVLKLAADNIDEILEVEQGEFLELDLSQSSDDHDSSAQLYFEFDLDYDGVVEQADLLSNYQVSTVDTGSQIVKIRVEDTAGLAMEKLVRIKIIEKQEEFKDSGNEPINENLPEDQEGCDCDSKTSNAVNILSLTCLCLCLFFRKKFH